MQFLEWERQHPEKLNAKRRHSPRETLIADRLPEDGERVTIRCHGMSFFTGDYVFESTTRMFHYLSDTNETERSAILPPVTVAQVVEWCGRSGGNREIGDALAEGAGCSGRLARPQSLEFFPMITVETTRYLKWVAYTGVVALAVYVFVVQSDPPNITIAFNGWGAVGAVAVIGLVLNRL